MREQATQIASQGVPGSGAARNGGRVPGNRVGQGGQSRASERAQAAGGGQSRDTAPDHQRRIPWRGWNSSGIRKPRML